MNKDIQLSPRIQEILNYYFQYPTVNYTELAKHFNISIQRISQIMSHPRVLESFPVLAKRKIKSLVPKAVHKLERLMTQEQNLNVAEKVVGRILDSEKVLEPVERLVRHTLEFKSTEELQRIVEGAKDVPQQAIEAEIVSDAGDDSDRP